MTKTLQIREFNLPDVSSVRFLWEEALPSDRPWNESASAIRRKQIAKDHLFFVGEWEGQVVATVVAGYDGVRGWIYKLAVAAAHQRRGFGRLMVEHAERALRARGCPKVNLQVKASNQEVVAFYDRLGFTVDDRLSLSKPLPAAVESDITHPVPEIKIDEQITLSQPLWSDKAALLKWFNETDHFATNMITVPFPYTESDAESWLLSVTNRAPEDKVFTWAIRDPAGEQIGCCCLSGMTTGEKAEVGYWLARPYWGQGIITRVTAQLCDYGFREHGLQRIFARVRDGNTASARVVEKCGFELEARLPNHFFKDGNSYDVLFYGKQRSSS